MTEGRVSWNDYCPRCKVSTPRNFGFGKIRFCSDCEQILGENLYLVKKMEVRK